MGAAAAGEGKAVTGNDGAADGRARLPMGGGPKPAGAPCSEALPGADGAANCPGAGGLIQVLATGGGTGVTADGTGAAVPTTGSAGGVTVLAAPTVSGLAAARQSARAKSPS